MLELKLFIFGFLSSDFKWCKCKILVKISPMEILLALQHVLNAHGKFAKMDVSALSPPWNF